MPRNKQTPEVDGFRPGQIVRHGKYRFIVVNRETLKLMHTACGKVGMPVVLIKTGNVKFVRPTTAYTCAVAKPSPGDVIELVGGREAIIAHKFNFWKTPNRQEQVIFACPENEYDTDEVSFMYVGNFFIVRSTELQLVNWR